ncbi:hypothetical protein HDU76_002997 [Blyttiomyces sp. JEL0837]|nr:hypothetical protein HDU76_002997 [Blyttiomyces sp. JEL0837]
MIAAFVFSVIFANAVSAIPTRYPVVQNDTLPPAMYSDKWMEDAIAKFLAHPDHPSYSETLAAESNIDAGVTCTSPPTFTCRAYVDDGITPSDVRHVRPKDISTIMAIGDSITAGFGMNSGYLPFASTTEYRGLVYDIGGDSGAVSIANFLKTYNPNLQGQAVGTTALQATIDVLSAAVSGARVADLPGQVSVLSNAYYSGGYNSNSGQSWKMIGILIGANNLCHVCENDINNSPDAFETQFLNTIKAIKSNFNNVIVNAYTLFNVSNVYYPQQTSSYCTFAQSILNECPCTNSAANRQLMNDYNAQYNQRIYKVASEFAGLSNFAVNVQPGVEKSNLANAGLSFLAEIDCFHPSQCSNEKVATILWNNMFQPAGKKTYYQLETFNQAPYCPGPRDYLM